MSGARVRASRLVGVVALCAAGAAAATIACSSDSFSGAPTDAGSDASGGDDGGAGADGALDDAGGKGDGGGRSDPCGDAATGAPAVIAAGQPNPASIAADSTGVYWSTAVADGGVWIVAPGCDPGAARAVVDQQPVAGPVLVGPQRVVFTTPAQQIGVVTKPIGAPPSFEASPRLYEPSVVALSPDGQSLYLGVAAGGVLVCDLGGCNDTEVELTYPTAPQPVALAADGALVAMVGQVDGGFGPSVCAAAGINVDTRTLVTEPTGTGGSVALSPTRVYWTNTAAGTVSSVGRDGSGVAVLATGESSPGAITLDDTYVYWTTSDSVHRARVDGTTPPKSAEVLATGLAAPKAIAQLDRFVYVTDQGAGTILRVPK